LRHSRLDLVAALSGGTAVIRAPWEGESGGSPFSGLAVDSTNVYWAYHPVGVLSVPVGGGAVTTFSSARGSTGEFDLAIAAGSA
jgi:hypothetical protein